MIIKKVRYYQGRYQRYDGFNWYDVGDGSRIMVQLMTDRKSLITILEQTVDKVQDSYKEEVKKALEPYLQLK